MLVPSRLGGIALVIGSTPCDALGFKGLLSGFDEG